MLPHIHSVSYFTVTVKHKEEYRDKTFVFSIFPAQDRASSMQSLEVMITKESDEC